MAGHVIKPLTLETWDAYARLIEKHNGVWGGCWCIWFHDDTPELPKKDTGGYDWRHRMGELGIAHAALVFDGDDAIGWAEYGSPAELPVVFSVLGKKISASFLFSSTRAMFEEAGFEYVRPLGTGRCVMRRTVSAANAAT